LETPNPIGLEGMSVDAALVAIRRVG
jgi:hypothetical protein